MRNRKILSIVGARPQFIKAGPVSRALADTAGLEEILVHTGQDFDADMSRVFFTELGLSSPRYNLGIAGGRRTIFVRALDQLVAQPVRGSEGGRHPVFSTDGTWLAFNTGADLMKVPTEGGQPMTVASGVGTLRGIHWMPDNTVVFAPHSL